MDWFLNGVLFDVASRVQHTLTRKKALSPRRRFFSDRIGRRGEI